MSAALIKVRMSDLERGNPLPRLGDCMRCLQCGSSWSFIADGIVRENRLVMQLAQVAPDRLDEIGNAVAWYGCDECELCERKGEPSLRERRLAVAVNEIVSLEKQPGGEPVIDCILGFLSADDRALVLARVSAARSEKLS